MRSPAHSRFGSKALQLVHSAGAVSNPQPPAPQAIGSRAVTWLDHIDWTEVAFWAAVGGVGYVAYRHLSTKKHRRSHVA